MKAILVLFIYLCCDWWFSWDYSRRDLSFDIDRRFRLLFLFNTSFSNCLWYRFIPHSWSHDHSLRISHFGLALYNCYRSILAFKYDLWLINSRHFFLYWLDRPTLFDIILFLIKFNWATSNTAILTRLIILKLRSWISQTRRLHRLFVGWGVLRSVKWVEITVYLVQRFYSRPSERGTYRSWLQSLESCGAWLID